MNLGLQITEKEYRKLPYPSYSLLSGIAKSGPVAVYGERADISDLDSIIIGTIVDSLVTEGKDPDNMVILDKKPSNKALAIIKALHARSDLKEESLLSVRNKKQIEEECNTLEYYSGASIEARIKYLKKYSKYAKALNDHGNDALFVSSYQLHEAKSIANAIFIRFPFLVDGELEIVPQVKIVGEVKGIKIKGMLDFIVINHETKTIIPFDLKTGIGLHDEFFKAGFLGWRYFIQSSLYKELLVQYIQTTNLSDYKISNFRFMYCGRLDKLPIIYKVTDKWHEAGLNGFVLENIKYTGVYDLLEEYEYCIEHPNNPYRKGYDKGEIDLDDSLCNILKNGE